MPKQEGDALVGQSAIMGRPVPGEALQGRPVQGSAEAPAEGSSWVGYDASSYASYTTNLTGATNNDLVFTSKALGGEDISIKYTDPGGATATLGVVVTGKDINVNLGRTASAVDTTATALKAAVDGDTAAAALVTVANAAANNGSGLVAALSKTNLEVA